MNRDHPGLRQKFPSRSAAAFDDDWIHGGAGCASYQANRSTQAAVDAALAPAKLETVRVAAGKLKHPLLAPVVIDGRDGFSPDEIALMVVIASPQLRALRDQRGVVQAQVVQAGILPNPQLGYALDQPTGHNEPGLVPGRNLGLSWEITSLLGRQDRVAGPAPEMARAKLSIFRLAWQEWQAAQDGAASRLPEYCSRSRAQRACRCCARLRPTWRRPCRLPAKAAGGPRAQDRSGDVTSRRRSLAYGAGGAAGGRTGLPVGAQRAQSRSRSTRRR